MIMSRYVLEITPYGPDRPCYISIACVVTQPLRARFKPAIFTGLYKHVKERGEVAHI